MQYVCRPNRTHTHTNTSGAHKAPGGAASVLGTAASGAHNAAHCANKGPPMKGARVHSALEARPRPPHAWAWRAFLTSANVISPPAPESTPRHGPSMDGTPPMDWNPPLAPGRSVAPFKSRPKRPLKLSYKETPIRAPNPCSPRRESMLTALASSDITRSGKRCCPSFQARPASSRHSEGSQLP